MRVIFATCCDGKRIKDACGEKLTFPINILHACSYMVACRHRFKNQIFVVTSGKLLATEYRVHTVVSVDGVDRPAAMKYEYPDGRHCSSLLNNELDAGATCVPALIT